MFTDHCDVSSPNKDPEKIFLDHAMRFGSKLRQNTLILSIRYTYVPVHRCYTLCLAYLIGSWAFRKLIPHFAIMQNLNQFLTFLLVALVMVH